MKKNLLLGALLACGSLVCAQSSDPVIMKINGHDIPRSEFEYYYNKNNTEGVIDKKTVEEYVPLFVNYKLKVEAAKAAQLDTAQSFQQEFMGYRDQQIRPALIDSADVERKAYQIYREAQEPIDANGGMVNCAHILIRMNQKASDEEMKAAKLRIDSIYTALQNGADFAELAKSTSQDPGTASRGGVLGDLVKGQVVKEFEDQVWALTDGELSKPFESPFGWHIIKRNSSHPFYSYESQRDAIYRFIDQRGLREQIISEKLDSLSKARNVPQQQIVDEKREEMVAADPQLRFLIQEYHDDLMVFDIASKNVWDKARSDDAVLEAYFKKNKKKYAWTEPRFKGIAYRTRDVQDVKAVQQSLKGLAFSAWAETLRKTFNADSVLRIRVEKGIFKKGDNALVDSKVFGVDTIAPSLKDYPNEAVYGKKIKAPEEMSDVKQLVVTDYQEYLEQQWVSDLRKRYPVEVDDKVVQTVNKH